MSLSRVFISYKREHAPSETLVSKIEKELAGSFKFLRDVNMQVGKRWTHELYDWLLSCDAAIIVVSKEANAADWCRREWSVLIARWEVTQLPLIPIFVETEFFETGILDEIQSTMLGSDRINEIKSLFAELPPRSLTPSDYLALHRAWLRRQFMDAPCLKENPTPFMTFITSRSVACSAGIKLKTRNWIASWKPPSAEVETKCYPRYWIWLAIQNSRI